MVNIPIISRYLKPGIYDNLPLTKEEMETLKPGEVFFIGEPQYMGKLTLEKEIIIRKEKDVTT